MVAIWKLRYKAYFFYVGPFEQDTSGHREPNIRTHACIWCIRSFVSDHPWATILDLESYRDAWQAGAEWAEHNSCRVEREKRDATYKTPAL
jgi:hypothetical protein